MKDVIFTTKNSNSYVYNYNVKNFTYLHPIIKFYIDLQNKQINIDNYIHTTNIYRKIQNKKYTKNELIYYLKKYNFYREQGILNNNVIKFNFNGEHEKVNIDKNLANISEIVYEVTEVCNLDCSYCCYGALYKKTKVKRNKSLNIKIAKQIIDFFYNNWQTTLNNSINDQKKISFYGGEALLRINFIKDVVKYIKSKNKNYSKIISFQITTNGVLLDKHIDFLVENNFTINVSLDGNLTNNKYRIFHNGTNSFNKVFENLIKIKVKYPNFFHSNFGFQAVLNDTSNVNEIIKFFENELNVKKEKIDFSLLDSTNVKKDKEIKFQKINYLKTNKNVMTLNDCLKLMTSITSTSFWDYKDIFKIKQNENLIPTGTCSPFEKKIFITARGGILPCERISFKYILGNVNDQGVNLDTEKIAKKINSYLSKVKNNCANCYRNYFCKKCIYNLLDEKGNDICPDFCDYNEFSSILSESFTLLERELSIYNKKLMDIQLDF